MPPLQVKRGVRGGAAAAGPLKGSPERRGGVSEAHPQPAAEAGGPAALSSPVPSPWIHSVPIGTIPPGQRSRLVLVGAFGTALLVGTEESEMKEN